MFWASPKPPRHDRRALTRALLLVLVIAAAAGRAGAQDLLPREVPGEEAAVFRFGQAPDLHGWVPDDSPVILERLSQLTVAGSEVGAPPVEKNGVQLQGMSVAGLDHLAHELSEWIGRPLTEAGLDRLTEVILRHHEEHDRPMTDVWVPPQTGEGGQLASVIRYLRALDRLDVLDTAIPETSPNPIDLLERRGRQRQRVRRRQARPDTSPTWTWGDET